MSEWLNTPLIVTATVGVIGTLIGIGVWIGRVNSDRENFKNFMKEIREDIGKIRENIEKIFLRLPTDVASGASPLKLTELGERISQEISAPRWAEGIISRFGLEKKFEGMSPYDVQESCISFCVSQENWKPNVQEHEMAQSVAYNSGLSTEKVYRVLGIVMRDRILSSRS